MKLTKCKRCDAPDLCWVQSANGRWSLLDKFNNIHHCDDGKLKAVKCKYCNAADLHWAEETNPLTQEKKAVLTESYGLPHACDERIAFLAKEKQDKKDKYEAEKKRVNLQPKGICTECKGRGTVFALSCSQSCKNCYGMGRFDAYTIKAMLANQRRVIWPNMKDTFGRKY